MVSLREAQILEDQYGSAKFKLFNVGWKLVPGSFAKDSINRCRNGRGWMAKWPLSKAPNFERDDIVGGAPIDGMDSQTS